MDRKQNHCDNSFKKTSCNLTAALAEGDADAVLTASYIDGDPADVDGEVAWTVALVTLVSLIAALISLIGSPEKGADQGTDVGVLRAELNCGMSGL